MHQALPRRWEYGSNKNTDGEKKKQKKENIEEKHIENLYLPGLYNLIAGKRQ